MPFTKTENKRNHFDIHSIVITEGQSLKIETSPDGEEILDIACPEGESWSVRIDVEIVIS